MATIINEINFKNQIASAVGNYGTKLANKEKLGNSNISNKFKFTLLTMMYEILLDYLDISDSTDENFFTTDEARDILEHFNRIANTTIIYTDFE